MANDSKRWIGGVEPEARLLAATGAQILEIECLEQPTRLQSLIRAYRYDAAIRSQLETFRAQSGAQGPILFLGMGASLCAAHSGAVHLQSNGRPSFSVDAGEWLHYGQGVWNEAGFSVLLSASGESAELVELLKARKKEAAGIITNNVDSTCWKLANNHLPVLAGPEYGNATKTYTNTTAAAIVLASEIVGLRWYEDAERTASIYEDSLEKVFARRHEIEEFCRGAVNLEVVGRGAGYGAAVMGALCIREMTGFRAAAHTGAGFKHGPNLDVDGTHVAMIFALGRAAQLGLKLADECVRRGGRVVLVSSETGSASKNLLPICLEAVPEPWEGITATLVAQALTLAMVERTGCRLPPRFHYGPMEQ